jgi:hypothetical protein
LNGCCFVWVWVCVCVFVCRRVRVRASFKHLVYYLQNDVTVDHGNDLRGWDPVFSVHKIQVAHS